MGLYVVMGVTGCGKSSVAARLAKAEGGDFVDADDFHSVGNKDKMTAGIPLTDEDRWGWIDALNVELKRRAENGRDTFLACSSLRQCYRERLARELPSLRFIYLKGSRETIRRRLAGRSDHFMPTALLESQFATLEDPPNALTVSVEQPLDQVVEEILRRLDER